MLLITLVICMCFFSDVVFNLGTFRENDSEVFSTMSFYTDRELLLPEWHYQREAEIYLVKTNIPSTRRSVSSAYMSTIDYS